MRQGEIDREAIFEARWQAEVTDRRARENGAELLATLKRLLNAYERTGDHRHIGGPGRWWEDADCIACEARAAIARCEEGDR